MATKGERVLAGIAWAGGVASVRRIGTREGQGEEGRKGRRDVRGVWA